MSLVVRSHEDLVEVLPHLLGFKPNESVVLVPLHGRMPYARVDMPTDAAEREEMTHAVREPYSRHAGPGDMVAIICVTGDRQAADLASGELATELANVGLEVPVRVWTTDHQWMEFNSGQGGERTGASATRLAAEAVGDAVALPLQSREAVAESLVGDRAPVAAALPAAREAAEHSTEARECAWVLDRLGSFHDDGLPLSDAESARLLLAIDNTNNRDAAWGTMTRANSHSQVALWTDVTRRAPDEVRSPAASMLGFASWLQGDGAKAWCALDQIPEGQPNPMASIVATALQTGVHPETWEKTGGVGTGEDVDESFVPPAHSPRPGPDMNGPGPERPGPAR